jgi:hypothetical protein
MNKNRKTHLNWLSPCFLHFYCAGWGYIVAFTKVLTIYQIYNIWTHPIHCSHLPPPPPNLRIVSVGIIFAFTYMYTQFLYHIHPPTPFPQHLPPRTGTKFLLDRTYSSLLFSDFIEEKRKNVICAHLWFVAMQGVSLWYFYGLYVL